MNENELMVGIMVGMITKDKNNLIIDNNDYQVWMNHNGDRYVVAKDNTFHMVFMKKTGFTAKWGKTFDDDPSYNPFGNEIADIEITKRCSGVTNCNGNREWCKHCYKRNTSVGDYMSFETFKTLFDKINDAKTMTQIAFGTGSSLTENENPDYWKIFDYAKANGVTPNVTVADVDEETAKKMAKTFGACAVSYYPLINKNTCYNSIKRILDTVKEEGRDMKVNIHCLLSEETVDGVNELLDDYHKDERLKGINAIVFLSLKQKGRGVNFNKMNYESFKHIIKRCMDENIPYGMDSCSANKFIKVLEETVDEKTKEHIVSYIEPCEATQFSSFFDTYGNYYPCSFMEKEGEWKEGIHLKDINSIKDVWYEKRVVDWRNESIKNIKCLGCNKCHFYDV